MRRLSPTLILFITTLLTSAAAHAADNGSLLLLIRYSTQNDVTTYTVDQQVSNYVPDTYSAYDSDPDNQSESDLMISYLDQYERVLTKLRIANPAITQQALGLDQVPPGLEGHGLEYGHFPLRVEYVPGMVTLQIESARSTETTCDPCDDGNSGDPKIFDAPTLPISPPQQLDLGGIIPGG